VREIQFQQGAHAQFRVRDHVVASLQNQATSEPVVGGDLGGRVEGGVICSAGLGKNLIELNYLDHNFISEFYLGHNLVPSLH
jgi:hypothetical protein